MTVTLPNGRRLRLGPVQEAIVHLLRSGVVADTPQIARAFRVTLTYAGRTMRRLEGYRFVRRVAIGRYGVLRWGALALLLATFPAKAAVFPVKYDLQIKQAAGRYLPGIPWRLWKAQLYQESKLNPDARSPVGAEGVAQFMPATWDEVTRAMGIGAVSRRDAGIAIEAGAYYMMRQRSAWKSMSDYERHRHAAASYNAGLGNIRRAWRRCDEQPLWSYTASCLPEITGRHAAETTTYIERIWRWWAVMESG